VRISCATEERLPEIPVQNITEYLRKKAATERAADGKQNGRKTGVGFVNTHARKYHVCVCSAVKATIKHEGDYDKVVAASTASARSQTNCGDDSDEDDEEQPRSKKAKAPTIPTRSSKRGKQDVVTPPPTSTVRKPKTVVSNY
jgi:hypothetical protein